MKSATEKTDTLGAIGSPIKPAPAAPAAPKPTGTPGILQGPDGKLSTNLPLPKAPAMVAEADEAGDANFLNITLDFEPAMAGVFTLEGAYFVVGGEPDDVSTLDGVCLGGRE